MNKPLPMLGLTVALGAATVLGLMGPRPALATAVSKWVGEQAGTYSGGNFSISGNVLTVTQTSTAGTLTVGANVNQSLLGINGLWIVSSAGGNVPAVTALTGGPTGAAWTAETTPAGFGGHPGYGNGNGSDWIMLGPTALVTADNGNVSPYTSGTFTFSGLSTASNYDIGIDYLMGNGNTGRAYFALPATVTPPAGTPEPSTVAPFAFAGLGLGGLMLRARKRKA